MEKPVVSIIIPVLNEQDNIVPLLEQIEAALLSGQAADSPTPGGGDSRQSPPLGPADIEVIIVDDGSTDQTPAKLQQAAERFPWLRPLRRQERQGQSAAMFAGIAHARAPWIAMMDGDLQNDPADLPAMIQAALDGRADLIQGDRSAARVEGLKRKLTTAVGRAFRRFVLADRVRDTGCTLRVLKTDLARQIPLQFMGVHRYIPVYCRLLGARILEMPVRHRPRLHGTAKYGMLDRAAVGLYDLLAIRWMTRRLRNTQTTPGIAPGTQALRSLGEGGTSGQRPCEASLPCEASAKQGAKQGSIPTPESEALQSLGQGATPAPAPAPAPAKERSGV